mmetsp:Transcript_18519/g.71501  ORF Transcript_18519/g.71501 Transcript_18519/m.71501 type:complete len:333 (+) Transcript_18519:1986-2984(+)
MRRFTATSAPVSTLPLTFFFITGMPAGSSTSGASSSSSRILLSSAGGELPAFSFSAASKAATATSASAEVATVKPLCLTGSVPMMMSAFFSSFFLTVVASHSPPLSPIILSSRLSTAMSLSDLSLFKTAPGGSSTPSLLGGADLGTTFVLAASSNSATAAASAAAMAASSACLASVAFLSASLRASSSSFSFLSFSSFTSLAFSASASALALISASTLFSSSSSCASITAAMSVSSASFFAGAAELSTAAGVAAMSPREGIFVAAFSSGWKLGAELSPAPTMVALLTVFFSSTRTLLVLFEVESLAPLGDRATLAPVTMSFRSSVICMPAAS